MAFNAFWKKAHHMYVYIYMCVCVLMGVQYVYAFMSGYITKDNCLCTCTYDSNQHNTSGFFGMSDGVRTDNKTL